MRQESVYTAIRELHNEGFASINKLRDVAGIPGSSYYKWVNRTIPEEESINQAIAEAVKAIHEEYPDKGCRRIRDDVERDYGFPVNDKRIL